MHKFSRFEIEQSSQMVIAFLLELASLILEISLDRTIIDVLQERIMV